MSDDFQKPDALEVQKNQLTAETAVAFDTLKRYLEALRHPDLTPEQRDEYTTFAIQWNEYALGLVDQSTALTGASADALKAIIDQRDTIANELAELVTVHDELIEAVKNSDTSHPAIARIEETLYEYLSETVWYEFQDDHQDALRDEREEGFNEGYANAVDELIAKISNNTGINTVDLIGLIEAMAGDVTITDAQLDDLVDRINNLRTGC